MTRNTWLAIGLVLAAGIYLTSNDTPAQVAAPAAAPAANPTADSLRGLALPWRQAVLNAPVDGTLLEVAVEEGQRVARGERLARMDDEVQRATVKVAELRAESESEKRRAQLERTEAENMLEQTTEAFEKGAAHDWEVRRAKVRRDLAAVGVDLAAEAQIIARAQLLLEQERLKTFALNAPWDGQVVRVVVDPGATMSRSDAVLRMVDITTLEVQLQAPVELFGQLKVGRRYALDAEAPVNDRIEGRLKFADRVIDPASQTFRCVFTIPNKDEALPGGFSVRLVWPQP